MYSALSLPLDEALSGVTAGLPLPNGVDAKPAAKVSTLKNGLKVASIETFSPVSTVGLVVGAGSTYESQTDVGASALFRQLAFKTNEVSSQLSIVRGTEELGGRLSAVTSRDHLTLLASGTRDNLDHWVDVLSNEFAYKSVLPWEVTQARDEIAYQAHATTHDGSYKVLDALHGAAFRGPLCHAVNPDHHRLDKVSGDQLKNWAAQKYVTGNAVLVGFGVQHDDLVRIAEEQFADAKSGAAATRGKSTYGGNSEARVDTAGAVSHVALGFEGAKAGTSDVIAVGVLQHALGVGPSVKWGASTSLFGQKLASVIKAPAALTAFSAHYADTGLFGVMAVSGSQDIGCVAGAARDVLKDVASKGLSKADIARGKAQLKLSVLVAAESAETIIEDMGAQVLSTGKILSPADMVKAIDSMPDAAINEVVKRVLSSKPTLAAVGDLAYCPRLDQLA